MTGLERAGAPRPPVQLDPRRNLAATAAGILGALVFALPWFADPSAPVDVARVRFILLVPVVLALTVVGIVASAGIGQLIVLVAALAAFARFVEYAREGRLQSIGLPLPGTTRRHR